MNIGDTSDAVFIDSTHCKVHQHSNGPRIPEGQGIGKSRGGLNRKIHMMVAVLGRIAAAMEITPCNTSDIAVAPACWKIWRTSRSSAIKAITAGNYGKLRA